jgi:MATE family multidrug resistance protein
MFLVQQSYSLATFFDTAMAGQISPDDLAAVALGSTLWVVVYVFLLGIMNTLNPELGIAYGEKNAKKFQHISQQGVYLGLFLGIVGAIIMLAARPLLQHFLSLDTAVKQQIDIYITSTACGLPAAIMYRALYAYSGTIGQTKSMIYVGFMGLILNIGLNYLFMYGAGWIPAFGGAGAGIATAIVLWFNFFLLRYRYQHDPRLPQPSPFVRWGQADYRLIAGLAWRGLPIGCSFLIEVTLFVLIAVFVADLGSITLAAHQSVLNFATMLYMIPQCLGSALNFRIAKSIGEQKLKAAYFSVQAGLLLAALLSLITAAFMGFFPRFIMRLYTQNPEVILLGVQLLFWAALFQSVDAVQTIASSALRAYQKTALPMMMHFLAFWVIGLLGGYALSLMDVFGPARGVVGFWQVLVLALSLAMIGLSAYALYVGRTHEAQPIQYASF